MDNPGDLMHLCRLCLVKDQVNIPIFEEHGDIRQIFVKISSCLPVKVSKDDQLPKRICDGCSNKLDLLYEFCNTSANSEKKLLSWLEQAGLKDVDTISAVAQHTAKPLETQTQVKQEALEDIHAAVQQTDHLELTDEGVGAAVFEENAIDESDEPPPPKRARRTAAVKAQINITPDSDDDDDMDISEPMTKVEDESDDSDVDKDPSYVDVPGTSADDQPGPSGVGKDGVEAPKLEYGTSYHCTSCNYAFETYALLLDHENQCVVTPPGRDDIKPLPTCPECHKTFACKRYLTNHINYVHKRKIPRISCPECPKTFDRTSVLNSHVNKVHRGIVEYYECDICGAKLTTKMNVINHKNAVHLKKFNVHCELCGKGYIFKGALDVHKKRVHDREVAIIPCTEEGCAKIFKTKYSLNYHLQAVHANDRPELICVQCDKVFTLPLVYKKHMRSHEKNGKSPYFCDVCGKTLSSSGSYKIHVRTHTGEKPHICDVCGRGFNSPQRLKEHGVVHTKERSHVCTECEKKFALRKGLRKHFKKCHSHQSDAKL